MKPIRVIIENGIDVNVDTIEEAVSEIIDYYRINCDSVIGEMLTYTQVLGISIDQIVDMYGYIMSRIENDTLIQMVEGEEVIRTL